MENLCFRTTIVMFTPTSALIVDSASTPAEPYLKLELIPTQTGKHIQSLRVFYSDTQQRAEELPDLTILMHSLKCTGETLVDRAVSYMRALPSEDVSVIVKEYTKYIADGVILDGFGAGIAAYIAFLLLLEHNSFLLPFQFNVPWTIQSGNILNRNMFQYLSLPLTALSQIATDILLQLVLFIQSFINIWDPLFIDGPVIGATNEARMCMDIISGFSQTISRTLAQTQAQNNLLSRNLLSLEDRLQAHINENLAQMRRELMNLIVSTRQSVKDIIMETQHEFDKTVKDKIIQNIEPNLEAHINNRIQAQIEASSGRLGEIVSTYSQQEGKKILTTVLENELKGTLMGLEHRIEILYDKLESLEKIPTHINDGDSITPNNASDPANGISTQTVQTRWSNPLRSDARQAYDFNRSIPLGPREGRITLSPWGTGGSGITGRSKQ